MTQNSPANRVPSHGTALYGTSHAIDFVPVNDQGRTAPFTFAALLRTEPASNFPGFGRPILAPVAGTIVAILDSEPDHDAFRGLPSVRYAVTQRQRASEGWTSLSGNHVMIETDGGPVVVLCHLQQGSITVARGQRVKQADALGRCGNSGNSTEPHLHLQVIDRLDAQSAQAVPFTIDGGLPRNGQIISVE
ncbi:M23 family metallopeptidase [Homoserinimonas aerilata]|nr:M23 family metallopeptidase [Homoserinimonas aerilata]